MGDGVTRIEAALVVEHDRRLTKEQSDQNAQRIKDVLQPDDPETVSKSLCRRPTGNLRLSYEIALHNI